MVLLLPRNPRPALLPPSLLQPPHVTMHPSLLIRVEVVVVLDVAVEDVAEEASPRMARPLPASANTSAEVALDGNN